MKKRIAFLLAVVMLLSMAACAAKLPRIIPRQKRPQKPARPSLQIPAK